MTQLDVFQNLRGQAPDELLDFLGQTLVFFPDQFRNRLKQVVDALPREGDNMQRVLELVRSQWRDLNSQQWVRIAVTGPGHTGKGSLVETLMSRRSEPAASIFFIVDTPGLEEYLGYQRAEMLPEELRSADIVLLVLDGQYGVGSSTLQMVERLARLDKPMLVALNKMDLVEDPGATLKEARSRLKRRVVPVSARRKETIDGLLNEIVAVDSRALYPLTQTFPAFRRGICNGVVTQSALACTLVGAIGVPVSDMLPMTAIQTGMLLKIARAFGCRLDRERARELIPMLAANTLVREASHRLRRRFPNQGKLIAVSVAGLWTYGLGKAAIEYFETMTRTLRSDLPLKAPAFAEAK